MTDATAPVMSVILLAPMNPEQAQKTIRQLRAQTRASELELVLVGSNAGWLEEESRGWTEFQSVRIARVADVKATGAARAEGFRHASAPLIAFAEEHAFPSPNWADGLVRAHAGDYAAVSVEMRNANPSSISRADMHLSFGDWMAPAQRGLVQMLPGHNTSYKRGVLASYDGQLAAMFVSEAVMHLDLAQRKARLFLENLAYIEHVNISTWKPFVGHKFLGGRIFAATRVEQKEWGIGKRLVYAFGAPLIPLVRFKRMLPNLRRTGELDKFDLKFWLALSVGLTTFALGEAVGYLSGSGTAERPYAVLELTRSEQLRDDERRVSYE